MKSPTTPATPSFSGDAVSVERVKLELIKLLETANIPLTAAQKKGTMESVWRVYQLNAMLSDAVERLVNVGLVDKLKTMLVSFASATSPYSNEFLSAWRMALRATGDICSQVGLMGPRSPSWTAKAGRQLRAAAFELTNAVRKTPFVQTPSQYPSYEQREDAITIVKMLCSDSLPIPMASVKAAKEGLRLATEIWHNPDNPPPDNTQEHQFAALCSRIMGDCINDLKNRGDPYEAHLDIPALTGVSWYALVNRCVELARDKTIALDLRADQMTLIYDFLNGTSLDDGVLIRAFVQNEAISTMSYILRLVADDKDFPHEPIPTGRGVGGAATFEDRMQLLWFSIMRYARKLNIPEAAAQVVSSDMLAHTQVWSITAPVSYALVLQVSITQFFDGLRTRPELYVEAATQLTRSWRHIEAQSGVPPEISRAWRGLNNSVLDGFNQLGNRSASVRRCGSKSCKRAWSAEGTALLACSRCKETQYCSRACQKADWKMHKTACKVPSS